MESSIRRHHVCQVLVIGSGVSGYCAAIQAGRLGCQTILIEKDEVLGGNSGPNLGVGITGADRYNHYATETGIIHEIQEDASWAQAFTHVSAGTMPYNISRRYEAVVQEYLQDAGVQVLKRHYARHPIVAPGGSIASVIVEDLASFQTAQIDVQHVVIEASGDGEIGALAGADFDVGSEAQSEFGERSAPVARHSWVQGTSLVAIAQRTDHEVIFVPPAGIPPFQPRLWHSQLSSYIHHHDGWFGDDVDLRFLYITEAGGQMNTIRDDGRIYEILLGQLWAEWDHIKNGPHREEARCWDLLWVSPKAGKRESRRFLGDVILTQTDLEAGHRFVDDVAYGGHDLDDHQPFGSGSNIFAHSIPPMYGIPYRACYSRNVPNLLLAGRLISATHLAHSSTRLMRTGGAIGQAVGLAAAICCQRHCTPVQVYQHHLEELRQGLLEADATILAVRPQADHDLAPRAVVTATSQRRFNDQEPGPFVPLTAPAGIVLWDWTPSMRAVEPFLYNDSEREQHLTLGIYRARCEPRWKSMEDYASHGRNDLRDSAFAELVSVPATVPAGHRGWLEVVLPDSLDLGEKDCTIDDDRLLIALSDNEHVHWALARRGIEIAEMVEHSHHSPAWRSLGVMAAVRLTPAPGLGEATNVVNGFHRRFSRGPTNMWMSDPESGWPQDLVLTWTQPQRFDRVDLTFDNLTRLRHENPWECGARVAPILIKSYELAYDHEGEWHQLERENQNHHRFRSHRFVPVTASKLRLRVLATHGGQGARVYQVRVS